MTPAPSSGEYNSKGLGYQSRGIPISLGIDSSGKHHLFIPYFGPSKIVEDKKSKGVHILSKPLLIDDKEIAFIDLICNISNLNQYFSYVILEILLEIEKEVDEPIKICYRVLNKWREFFSKETKHILSKNELIGLFGELWHLREILKINPNCIDIWTGPNTAEHDIKNGNLALEIKTTTKREGRFFEVHGIEQLMTPEGGNLYLATMKIEEVPNGVESVPGLIDSICNLGVDCNKFFMKLAEIEYYLDCNEEYSKLQFEIKENRLYFIDDDFPRIVPDSFVKGFLPQNIVKIYYTLDLTVEPPYAITESEIITLYEQLSKL